MGIEALKKQLAEGKISKEEFAAELKKLLDAGTITQDEHDAEVTASTSDPNTNNNGGGLSSEQVQAMIDAAVKKAEQAGADKVRREMSDKLKEKDELLRAKMTDEEKAKLDLEQSQKDLEQRTKDLNAREVALHTVDALTEKQLPLSFKGFLSRETKEDTDKVIVEFAAEWQKALDAEVKKRFKEGGGDPPGGKSGGTNEVNPFDPKTLNMTEQFKMYKEDPVKAKRLAEAAGVPYSF